MFSREVFINETEILLMKFHYHLIQFHISAGLPYCLQSAWPLTSTSSWNKVVHEKKKIYVYKYDSIDEAKKCLEFPAIMIYMSKSCLCHLYSVNLYKKTSN